VTGAADALLGIGRFRRRFRLRLGIESRYVFRLYLQRTFLFTLVMLLAILALEAASNLGAVYSDRAAASGVDGSLRLVYFVLLRGGYDLPLVLPVGALMGVVWAEHGLASSRQRIMMLNAGRSPFRSLAAAALVALVLGPVQFAALAYLRPAAVAALGTAKLRGYGPQFDAPRISGPQWAATNGALVRFRVDFTHPVTLHDLLVFAVDENGAPRALLTAQSAQPTGTPGEWMLRKASRWTLPRAAGASRQPMDTEIFESLGLPLSLDPLWVANVGTPPGLIGQASLVRLAEAGQGVPMASAYQSVAHERIAAPFFVLGLTLLAAVLSMRWFRPGMHPLVFLRIGAVGIGIYFASATLSSIGSYGLLPAVLSAWPFPVALIAIALLLARSGGPSRFRPGQEQVPWRSGAGRRQ